MQVKEHITHILLHTNAEANQPPDQSQTPEVGRRAQYVRDAVDSLKVDSRELTLDELYDALLGSSTVDADKTSYDKTLTNAKANDSDGPQTWIQNWVRAGEEKISG